MLQEGMRLGPYEIVGLLGAGGMGKVYRARDTRLGRDVAIKMMADATKRPAAVRRFEIEARAAGSLSHPNVMSVYDVGVHEGAPFIVAELLKGKTLRELQGGRPLPVRTAIDLARQFAHGLAAAHERGLVHRDLKPENLFVSDNGRLKILDFGLAKPSSSGEVATASQSNESWLNAAGPDTATGAIVGTVGYMSPEQVRGAGADERSDIFSAGAVIHEMFTGQRLFQRATRAEVGLATTNEEAPELGPPVPAEISRVVERCLRKKPEDRFQSGRDLAFALESRRASVRRALQPSAIGAFLRRRWAIAGVAVLAAAGTFAFVSRPRPPEVSFHRMTFRPGRITGARFAPDGKTVVYSAAWQGKPEATYVTSLDNAAPFPFREIPDSNVYAISRDGELLLGLRPHMGAMGLAHTLARAPMAGAAPREILDNVTDADWSPDGKSIAVAHVVADGTVLEYPIGHVLWHSGATLDNPRVSPGNDRVAVMQWSPGSSFSIWVVDRDGHRTQLADHVNDEGFAWGPGGKEIWFVRSGELRAVDLSGRQRLLANLFGTGFLLDVSRDGKVFLGREDSRSEIAISAAANGGQTEDASWLNETTLADMTPDGSVLLFRDGSDLYLRRAEAQLPILLGKLRSWRGLSPDGRQVLAVDGEALVALSVQKGAVHTIPLGGVVPLNAQFMPDGKGIVVAGGDETRAARLYRASLTDPPKLLWDGVVSPQSWLVSPDGTQIAAVLASGALTVIPSGGGTPRVVATSLRDVSPVSFLDDKTLVMADPGKTPPALYKVNLTTGESAFWHTVSPRDPSGVMRYYHFIGSRTGDKIAFDFYRQRSDLYLADGLR
jgi:Tol biopolymer transport system component